MNNYYTLIYLARELKAILDKAKFIQAVTFKKNMLDLFFESDGEDIKLSISTDSVRTACFLDPRVSTRKSNTASFFDFLHGARIQSVETAESDRYIYIRFAHLEPFLLVKLFGSEPNVFVIEDGKVLESFKNKTRYVGAAEPLPNRPVAIPLSEAKGSLKRKIQQAFPLLPRNFIPDLIKFGELSSTAQADISTFLGNAELQLKHNPVPKILKDGRFTLLSADFIDTAEAEHFKSLNDALRVAFYTEARENRFETMSNQILQKAKKLQTKYNNIITASDEAYKSLERAERYEQYGNILVSHAHQKSDGASEIELPDLYNENQSALIPLDPTLDLASNAQKYFDKKKKSERSYESSIAYGKNIKVRQDQLNLILEKLSQAEHVRELEELMQAYADHDVFQPIRSQQKVNTKPYKISSIGKYEVWLGKNSKSNDAVLRDSHKEDIWMHASGLSGSHLILRMNKAQNDPDMAVIEQAASWAAWFSKGKGAQLCPVKWTRRKFVRKPKHAPPGAAVVDREQVVLVKPAQPLFEEYR